MDFLVIKEEEQKGELGEDPWHREIKRHLSLGVINLDKPSGPGSHEVAAWVKRMFGLSKVGHGGTLEALTGEIPPCPACSRWPSKRPQGRLSPS
ncbi:tRNA pseudouridine synthase A [Tardisphaera miroshnichenkoae]